MGGFFWFFKWKINIIFGSGYTFCGLCPPEPGPGSEPENFRETDSLIRYFGYKRVRRYCTAQIQKIGLLFISHCSSTWGGGNLAMSVTASPTYFVIRVWEVISSTHENVRKKKILHVLPRFQPAPYYLWIIWRISLAYIPTRFQWISTPPPLVSIYFRVHTPAPTPAPTPSQPCPIPIVFSPQCIRSSAYMAFVLLVARKSMCDRAVYVGSRYRD